MSNKLAIVTGASTGIGLELAKIAAREGYDLIVVADEPQIDAAAGDLQSLGVDVQSVEADLATFEGNDRVLAAANGRPIDVLIANAGRGLGHAFVEQSPTDWRRVIDTNVTGTTYLLQKAASAMTARGEGRILIVGSIAGLIPGSYQAVYNGTKAYLDSFSYALREELKDSGVSVSVLMPGPTDTEFFRRANMLDTPVGQDDKKEDPAKTAANGWEAMMDGTPHVVSGFKNKVQAAMSHLTPDTVLASQHAKMADPTRHDSPNDRTADAAVSIARRTAGDRAAVFCCYPIRRRYDVIGGGPTTGERGCGGFQQARGAAGNGGAGQRTRSSRAEPDGSHTRPGQADLGSR